MKSPEQILREQIAANGITITDGDWKSMMLCNVTVKSAIEMAEIYKNQPKTKKAIKPKISLVSFRLTMPNVGSWNGQWTGAYKMYYIIRKCITDKFLNEGQTSHTFHYSWDDGWGANVSAEIVDAKEAAKRRKISAGFCGYDWMVDSLIDCGEILTKLELKSKRESQHV